MKLTELDPKWWAEEGRSGQGVVFLCPCEKCRTVPGRQAWICVAFANPVDGGEPWKLGTGPRDLWGVLYGNLRDPAVRGRVLEKGQTVIPPGYLWRRSGDTFEGLTLAPSVDASPAGCWHGFVTNGECR